ncbi:MAG: PAS domain S-box protein [Cyclobacteriaceae bacterium]
MSQIKELFEKRGAEGMGFVQMLPIPVCVTDYRGVFMLINQAYSQFYGYTPDELLGQHFTKVVPEGKKQLLSQLHDDFIDKKFELLGEWEVQDAKGKLRKILSHAAYVLNEKGSPCKITFLVEIKESSQVEKRLYQTLLRLNDEQTVKIHQHALSLYEDGVDATELKQHDLEDYINRKQAWLGKLFLHRNKIIHLLETTSELEQMEKGQLYLEYKVFDIKKMILNLLSEKKDTFASHRIELQFTSEDEDGQARKQLFVEADEIYIELMLHNLLLNALETCRQGGKIDMKLRKSELLLLDMSYTYHPGIDADSRRKTGDYIVYLVSRQHGGDVMFSRNEQIIRISLMMPISSAV